MSTASLALEAQVWSVMESLAKAAAAEICSLVDSQCVEMRLEIRRGQTEIESLKGKLRELRKALREKSTSTVSQINPQLGESERGISTNDHQEDDCKEKEEVKKTSSPGLMILQEDSIQDDLNSHLNSGVQEQEKRRTETQGNRKILNKRKEEAPTSASRVKIKIESIEDDENMQVIQDTTSQNTRTENEEVSQVWSSEENTEMFFYSTYDQAHHRSDPAADMEGSYGPPEDRMEMTRFSKREDVARHSEPSTDSLHVAMDDLLRAQNAPGLQQSNSNTHNTLIHPHPEAQSNFSALSALPVRGRQSNQAMDVDKRRFPCMFCCKTFDQLSHAERHQRMHTGEKPFSCGLCGQRFMRKWGLKKHLTTHRSPNRFHVHSHAERLQQMHNGEKSFSCRLCGRVFTRKCSLKSHLKTHRKVSKAFDSNHCNPIDVKEENYENITTALDEEKTSSAISFLMQSEDPITAPPVNHISTSVPLHTTEASMMPNVLPEPVTQRPRLVTSGLRRRARKEQRFICVQCGKTFDRMSGLERHQVVHTGEKPYSCGLCGKGFTQKSHLKRHMRRNCCPYIDATGYIR